ncbi:unnamed protein product [Albugo candida]|uniref:Uncharacterized protein n=1 Tax=Albugo candida TaxID=65357 RepID=A0A024FTR3_9STRA|nr:unnamed protein product [Albugo candida]|eukprot:CCI10485.1 unnamed protein product [Albugo candida]
MRYCRKTRIDSILKNGILKSSISHLFHILHINQSSGKLPNPAKIQSGFGKLSIHQSLFHILYYRFLSRIPSCLSDAGSGISFWLFKSDADKNYVVHSAFVWT